jgi:hypothetical protein
LDLSPPTVSGRTLGENIDGAMPWMSLSGLVRFAALA